MKNLLKYNQFVKEYLIESKLPYSIEKDLQSLKLNWIENKKISEKIVEEKGKDVTHIFAFTSKNENRGLSYTFKTWFSEGSYWIELFEDDYLIFVQDYNSEEKRYFDQDCESIIGRKLQ